MSYLGIIHNEPEEIIYNDQFSISISDLVTKHNPRSVMQLQSLLDDNGYYGRCKVHDIYSGGHRTYSCKVKVNMIWSKYSYSWPYKGRWSFNTNSVERMFQVKEVDMNMSIALNNLLNSYGIYIHDMKHTHSINRKSEKNIRELLNETGAFRLGKFVLTDRLDLQEFKENVLNIKY